MLVDVWFSANITILLQIPNDLLLQSGEIVLDDVPEDFVVDLVVIMHQDVSHLFDDVPLCLRMFSFKFWGKFADGFAYDLDVMGNGVEME